MILINKKLSCVQFRESMSYKDCNPPDADMRLNKRTDSAYGANPSALREEADNRCGKIRRSLMALLVWTQLIMLHTAGSLEPAFLFET